MCGGCRAVTTQNELPTLPIDAMHERHPGLTDAAAAFLVEALCVCLDRHHTSPTDFTIITGDAERLARVEWKVADQIMQASHGNENDATRDGACACAIAALELARSLVVITRAQQGSGADYYVAASDTDWDDLEDLTRFEVSGIDHGQIGTLRARIRGKITQLAAGNSATPGIAGVVLFDKRWIELEDMDPS